MELPYDPRTERPLAGTAENEHTFIAGTTTDQVLSITDDPALAERAMKGDSQASLLAHVMPTLRQTASLRQEVQRMLAGRKRENAKQYGDYILKMVDNPEFGVTPPITLYTPKKLKTVKFADGSEWVLIPFGEMLVAIDGETQLVARFEASRHDVRVRQLGCSVIIHHGRSEQWARQAFYDLNVLGVQPNAAIAVSMDMRDPMTSVARTVEKIPFFKGRVEHQRRQLSSSAKEVVTISALRTACVTTVKGIAGTQYGLRPVVLTDDEQKLAETVCIHWWTAVTEAIGTAISDKNTVASAPPVLAAIGAVGSELMTMSPAQMPRWAAETAASLGAVRWDRGSHWNGIAGKVTASGKLAIGGTKETASLVYKALTDPSDETFKKIRGPLARVLAS